MQVDEADIAPFKHKNVLLGRMRKQIQAKKVGDRAKSQQHTCRNRARRVQITTRVDAAQRADHLMHSTLPVYSHHPGTPLTANYFGPDALSDNAPPGTTRNGT